MKRTVDFGYKEGLKVIDYLHERHIHINANCGGNGICGKCRVIAESGDFTDRNGNKIFPDSEGRILACSSYPVSDFSLCIDDEVLLPDCSVPADACDLALDIGTTTLCFAFLNASGEIVREYSVLNPQREYGLDVISRISAGPEAYRNMQSLLFSYIKYIVRFSEIRRMYVTGNTTMLHLFAGVSPESIGVYPFKPVFTETMRYSGEYFDLPFDEIVLLPSASAYIGADIVGGAYVSGVYRSEKPAMIADLGTNGEMILSAGGKMFSTSSAAGPALEGGQITYGTGGIPGAVCNFNGCSFMTVDDRKPIGICGSGLVDIIAALVKRGLIDDSGYLEEEYEIAGTHKSLSGKALFTGGTGIMLEPKDVRAFQLAKSAVCSAIQCLMEYAGLGEGELDKLYIAGSLGEYINVQSALVTGLYPRLGGEEKFVSSGNAALKSAILALRDENVITQLENISENLINVDLNLYPGFSDLFIDNMCFEL